MTENKPVVYVVDDDPSVLKALERLLRSAGHDAKIFSSAFECLDFNHPDVPPPPTPAATRAAGPRH